MLKDKDKRIDEYIGKAAEFSRPVLSHLRELIHMAVPEVHETIKWGMPSFDYKGPLCNMAAFKQHCVFGFWKYTLIKDSKGYLGERSNKGGEAMGNLGRMTGMKDLPPDAIIMDFIVQAKKLNDDNIKVPAPIKKEKKELEIPAYFMDALKGNKKALATFGQFSPSNKKEYVDWVSDAKTDATRETRLEQAVEWMAEGKVRNWKYLKK